MAEYIKNAFHFLECIYFCLLLSLCIYFVHCKLLQFVTHAYTVALAMDILGLESPTDVLTNCPDAQNSCKRKEMLSKLAASVVDKVFLKPENLESAVKLAGETAKQHEYCICDGGTAITLSIYPGARVIYGTVHVFRE